MDFYNPYIIKGKFSRKQSARRAELQDLTRIVPNCLRTSGSRELTVAKTSSPPVVFVDDRCHPILSPDASLSYWSGSPRGDPPAGVCSDPRDVRFHVYDIVETSYYEDMLDDVPLRFQGDIVPSGIVLKLLGRTREGESVCVNAFRQKLYFYVSGGSCEEIHRVIKFAINEGRDKNVSFFINKVSKRILEKFDRETHDVFRVELGSQTSLYRIASRLEHAGFRLYESGVDAVTRFVLDRDFGTFGWYTARGSIPRPQNKKNAWTTLEFDCAVDDLTYDHDCTDWPDYGIMSFDIECIGDSGFPTATNMADMIIQISCVFWNINSAGYRRVLLTVGSCEKLEGIEVYEFPSEFDLLYGLFSLMRDGNVEFITGYNIANFDLQYIIDRASQVYNIDPANFSRVKSGKKFEVQKPRESLGSFSRASSKIKIAGLVPIDMYNVCKDKLSLSDYKLNTVAAFCLKSRKDDVSYKEIPSLFREGPAGRAKVGHYCVMDSVIVMDLLRFFMTHVEISEIAKISRIPLRKVLSDGQQIRVFTCLLAAAAKKDYILPSTARGSEDGYQGATVINPIPGFYNEPVLVVDFASLYPSIIQAHNLCYSTMIPPTELHRHGLGPGEYDTYLLPSGPIHFAKPAIAESLLANLLTAWLQKRRDIRARLATCEDESLRVILDKQQLAIKVTCNSVYGFTGVSSGLLPCIRIAETVTYLGRRMLDSSKEFVDNLTMDELSRIAGRPLAVSDDSAVRVIYGDTDSLFVLCRGLDVATVQAFSDPLAAHITRTLFTPPIKLEAEKIFQCLMLLTKKRYIGILPDKKLVMKGVDLIRRTACRFVQTKCREVLNLILTDDEVMAAAQAISLTGAEGLYARGLPEGFTKVTGVLTGALRDLMTNRVEVADLVFTTELSRPISVYKTTCLPHLRVYQKKIDRGEEAPQLHDRIPYVFVKGHSDKVSDLAEDPDYVIKHNLPLASELYFDKLIHGVANILQCLFSNNCDVTVSVLYNFLPVPLTFNKQA